jgi:histone H3/H4
VLKIPRFEPLQPSPSNTNDGEQPFEDAELQESEQLLEDGDMDQPDILLTGSIAYKPVKMARTRNRKQKILRNSRHGIPYPSLPPGVTKKIAITCLRALGSKKSTVNKDTLAAMVEAGERYFEQVSEDLGAFAQHAGRRKIDESDIIAIMKRYVMPPYNREGG